MSTKNRTKTAKVLADLVLMERARQGLSLWQVQEIAGGKATYKTVSKMESGFGVTLNSAVEILAALGFELQVVKREKQR